MSLKEICRLKSYNFFKLICLICFSLAVVWLWHTDTIPPTKLWSAQPFFQLVEKAVNKHNTRRVLISETNRRGKWDVLFGRSESGLGSDLYVRLQQAAGGQKKRMRDRLPIVLTRHDRAVEGHRPRSAVTLSDKHSESGGDWPECSLQVTGNLKISGEKRQVWHGSSSQHHNSCDRCFMFHHQNLSHSTETNIYIRLHTAHVC